MATTMGDMQLPSSFDGLVTDGGKSIVYGEPYTTADGTLVITVAKVRNRGRGSEGEPLETVAKPLGVFVIKDGDALAPGLQCRPGLNIGHPHRHARGGPGTAGDHPSTTLARFDVAGLVSRGEPAVVARQALTVQRPPQPIATSG